MRKALERTSSQGANAKKAAANKPVALPYHSLPILYTANVHPKPNSVTRKVPPSTPKPKALKNIAAV
jgi:hypothetical protein